MGRRGKETFTYFNVTDGWTDRRGPVHRRPVDCVTRGLWLRQGRAQETGPTRKDSGVRDERYTGTGGNRNRSGVEREDSRCR